MSQKINIDFRITSNLYTLFVLDLSVWANIENKPAIIEITGPGSKTPTVNYFDKSKNNVYGSIELGANCEGGNYIGLSDGIYTVTVKGSPSKYQKTCYYLKSDQFQLDLDEIYMKAFKGGFAPNGDLDRKLIEIEVMMRAAEAFTRNGLIDKAAKLFEKSSQMVDRLKNCRDCYKDVRMY